MEDAISLYHQALSLKADDPFSTDMLNKALEEQSESSPRNLFDFPSEIQGSKTDVKFPFSSSSVAWAQKEDSMLSDAMESDVDMSAAS